MRSPNFAYMQENDGSSLLRDGLYDLDGLHSLNFGYDGYILGREIVGGTEAARNAMFGKWRGEAKVDESAKCEAGEDTGEEAKLCWLPYGDCLTCTMDAVVVCARS